MVFWFLSISLLGLAFPAPGAPGLQGMVHGQAAQWEAAVQLLAELRRSPQWRWILYGI